MRTAEELPQGTWIYFRDLPPTCTEERLSELLVNLGLNIPPENISVKQIRIRGGVVGSAIVCITKECLIDTLNWILNSSTMDGQAVTAMLPQNKLRHSNTRHPEQPWPPAEVKAL